MTYLVNNHGFHFFSDKPWFDFRKWYQVMKKSFDEKKQKWEEARAKYVLSSSLRFAYLFSSLLLYI